MQRFFPAMLVMLMLLASNANSAHFRGGSVSWAALALDGDGQVNDVEVRVKTACALGRTCVPFSLGASPALALTRGTPTSTTLGDYILEEVVFTGKDLDPDTQYAINYRSGARIGSLINNANGAWDIQTIIYLKDGNRAPKIDLPIIFEVPKLQSDGVTTLDDYNFQLISTDPDADSMRYRLANTAELGGSASYTNPAGFSINANTGLITWTGSGSLQSGLYSAGLVVEDVDVNGDVKSKSHVDFILDLQDKAAVTYTVPATIPESRTVTVEKGESFDFSINSVASISTASLGDLQGALTEPSANSYHFEPGSIGSGLDPGTYPITFEVVDSSGTTTKNYLVLSFVVPDPYAPKITDLEGDSAAYSGAAGLLIDAGQDAVVSDIDDTHLNGGFLKANISFTDGEYETLSLRSIGDGAGEVRIDGSDVFYQGSLIGAIDRVENGIGEALKISLNSDDATIEAVQALVRSLTYTDTFVLREAGVRQLSVFVQDPSGKNNAYSVNVDVQDHPDKPATSAPFLLNNAMSLADGDTVTLNANILRYIDSDNDYGDITISVSNVANGQFEATGSPGAAISSFTQAQINAGSVVFAHAGNDTAPTYSLSASDGTNTTAVEAGNINFTGTSSISLSVAENITGVATVSAAGVTGTPAFAISGGIDAALFDVDAATGALTFLAAPDFENPADDGADNTYTVIVQVTGSVSGTAIQTFLIGVGDSNESPPVITGGGSVSIDLLEGNTAVTTVAATDPDGAAAAIYSLSGGADMAAFSIDVNTGALSFNSAPSYATPTDSDTNNSYVVEVQVSDGSFSANQTITVNVRLPNSPPAISSNGGGDSAVVQITEGTTAVSTIAVTDPDAGDSATFSLSGTDGDLFDLDPGSGELTFKVAPSVGSPADANADNRYEVIVIATDSAGATDQQALAIDVLTDTDGDGIADVVDADDDNDGLSDVVEGNGDADGDGIPDSRDTDSDGDGVADATEGRTDTDGDGIPNSLDLDSDADGIADAVEGVADSDGDGTPDYLDSSTDEDGDGIPDSVEGTGDADDDGTPNFLDPDSDNDGLPDSLEQDVSLAGSDTDSDGTPDAYDADSDGDGIPDAIEMGFSLLDGDLDGIDDSIDVDVTGGSDANGDGIDDAAAAADTDLDGVPDYLDLDSDNDGASDTSESQVTLTSDGVSDVVDDADGDGIADPFDVQFTGGVDANGDGVDDAVGSLDTDGDGVSDYLDLDSDNDSLLDVVEAGFDDVDNDGLLDQGLRFTGQLRDSDADGVPDLRDLDSDGDGVFDILGTPLAALSTGGDGRIDSRIDVDGDGIMDVFDAETAMRGTAIDGDGDGVPAHLDGDDDDDGIADVVEGNTDDDGDGIPNRLDRDSDNDGIPDQYEADRPVALGSDTDLDGIDDVFDSDALNDLDVDGDGVADRWLVSDIDGDGIADHLDNDSDGDGISDTMEQMRALPVNADQDQDGIDDAWDVDATGGVDANGDGVDDAMLDLSDMDGDGLLNFRDTDSDGDGFADADENGDYNNDGIPDYRQQDPGLETALKGSGGSTSLGFILGGLLLAVARKLHRAYRSVGFYIVACLGLMLLGASANAGDSVCRHGERFAFEFPKCWYIGGGIGASYLNPDDDGSSWEVTDNYDVAFKINLGYRLFPRWFLELSYADLGEAGLRNLNPAISDKESISYRVPALSFGYSIFRHDRRNWNLFFRSGVASIRNQASSSSVPFDEQSSAQFYLSAGFDIRVTRRWFARVEFDSYDADARYLGFSFNRYFGKANQ